MVARWLRPSRPAARLRAKAEKSQGGCRGRETAGRGAAVPRIEEAKPSVYYLPDKDGNLQPVLDFKYQDFEELYKLKNQLGRRDEPPRYSVQRMTSPATRPRNTPS